MFILAILVIILLIGGIIFLSRALDTKGLSDNTYVCPNCGYHFKTKWYRLIFTTSWNNRMVSTFGKAFLKCPKCQKRDICKASDM